jgi:hypothetical protein
MAFTLLAILFKDIETPPGWARIKLLRFSLAFRHGKVEGTNENADFL